MSFFYDRVSRLRKEALEYKLKPVGLFLGAEEFLELHKEASRAQWFSQTHTGEETFMGIPVYKVNRERYFNLLVK